MEITGSNALNCVYALIAGVSFLFAVLSLIGTEIGDAFDLDADADIDLDVDHGFHFAHISPFALAAFGATFGLVGLVTTVWAEMTAIPSILIAAGAGLLIGGLAHVGFIFILSPSKSSHYSLEEDAIGREVEVTNTIPAEGKGQVAFTNISGRVSLGARSATGETIPSGTIVVIDKVIGRLAIVRPVELK
jgi:hypothetical protein